MRLPRTEPPPSERPRAFWTRRRTNGPPNKARRIRADAAKAASEPNARNPGGRLRRPPFSFRTDSASQRTPGISRCSSGRSFPVKPLPHPHRLASDLGKQLLVLRRTWLPEALHTARAAPGLRKLPEASIHGLPRESPGCPPSVPLPLAQSTSAFPPGRKSKGRPRPGEWFSSSSMFSRSFPVASANSRLRTDPGYGRQPVPKTTSRPWRFGRWRPLVAETRGLL